MSDPDPSRVQQIFAEAIELGPEHRERFLQTACAGNAALASEVQALLTAHAQAEDDFLAQPAAVQVASDQTLADDIFETAGTRVGRYKLLEKIGEGGFGTVFLAEQSEPIRRRVALKVIKLGMDTRQVIARFEAERQALAILDHPNIAKVLDAGATTTGRPYFVMELVRGSPMTEYCDAHKLSPRQRLELFVQVCAAVQHAHTKGIIHRDLKPTNVLVTEQEDRPVPKVIDFGVAKATQARLTERTLFTELRQMVGTPAYMSPEQTNLDSADIDTRSDVYALGVLLYELLTGTTPIEDGELRKGAYEQMQRMIRELEPPKPSTRLSAMGETIASVAAVRSVEPRQLSRTVRGELDWIVMKCLEKDRTRRYESASSLAADLSRHLAGEAVTAGRPGALYRMEKSARRHRVALAVAAVFLLAATSAAAFYLHGVRAEQRNTRAALEEVTRQKAIAEAVSQFQSDMLAAANPRRQGERVTVLQVIEAAVAQLDAGKLKDQPLVEAAVRTTIGGTLQYLGRFDEARPNFEKALQLRRKHLPAAHRDIAASLRNLGWLIQNQGQGTIGVPALRMFAEAEALQRAALEMRRQILPADDPEIAGSLNMLGIVMLNQNKLSAAEPLLREALSIRRKATPADAGVNVLSNLGQLLRYQGKLDESEQLLREAVELSRKMLPASDTERAFCITNLGLTLQARGELAEAESLLRESLDLRRKALPAGHQDLARSIRELAYVLQLEEKPAEAEPLFRESVQMSRMPIAILQLAFFLNEQHRSSEAAPLFHEVEPRIRVWLDYCSRSFGRDDRQTQHIADQLARLLEATDRPVEAAALRNQYASHDAAARSATSSSATP
jgi:tetratricopeptide (TPR) repeat protein